MQVGGLGKPSGVAWMPAHGLQGTGQERACLGQLGRTAAVLLSVTQCTPCAHRILEQGRRDMPQTCCFSVLGLKVHRDNEVILAAVLFSDLFMESFRLSDLSH